ncbi:MAG: HEPN domain-containing protein [Turneriella sp.]
MQSNRAQDWLATAENDWLWGRDSAEHGYHSQACFIAQQVAEKALKAVALHRGFDQLKSHSVRQIARFLQINAEIEEAAKVLDQYYIPTRYPDAFAEGVPQSYYDRQQAESALALAEAVLKRARAELHGK